MVGSNSSNHEKTPRQATVFTSVAKVKPVRISPASHPSTGTLSFILYTLGETGSTTQIRTLLIRRSPIDPPPPPRTEVPETTKQVHQQTMASPKIGYNPKITHQGVRTRCIVIMTWPQAPSRRVTTSYKALAREAFQSSAHIGLSTIHRCTGSIVQLSSLIFGSYASWGLRLPDWPGCYPNSRPIKSQPVEVGRFEERHN